MSDKKYKEWLELMKDTPKEEILKYHYKLLFKVDKQKKVLDKIKEKVNQYESIRAYYEYLDGEYWETDYDDDFKEELLELLEEIE